MANENKAKEPNKQEVLQDKEQLALDDARRVKVLSPGMLVFKRFIRNKLAVVGIIILVFMFFFSFIGPLFGFRNSPLPIYERAQVFYKDVEQFGDYATGKYVDSSRFYPKGTGVDSGVLKVLGEHKEGGKYALTAGEEIPFASGGKHYTLKVINPDPEKPSCAVYGTTHIATASRGEVSWYDESFVDETLLAAIRENSAQPQSGTELAYNGMTISIEASRIENKYFAPSTEPLVVSSYSSYTPLLGRVADLQADTEFLANVVAAIRAGETTVTREGESFTLTGDMTNDYVLSAADGTELFNVVHEFQSESLEKEETDENGKTTKKKVSFLSTLTDGEGFITALRTAISEKADSITFEEKSYSIHVNEDGGYYLTDDENTPVMNVLASFVPVATKYDELSSDFNFINAAENAIALGGTSFEHDGETYTLENNDGSYTMKNAAGDEVVLATNIEYGPAKNGIVLTADFADKLREAMNTQQTEFTFVDQYGHETEARIELKVGNYYVRTQQSSTLFDQNAAPTKEHLLGTEGSGMDVFTRLMYGGRVSLIVGFVVVFFEIIIGVIVGGISGYFGGVVDTIMMRFVELFNCIPFYPMLIILGSVMDSVGFSAMTRLFMTMVILGILGWTGIARVVRGQILSLREQDFMVAAEATGIKTSRRIFRHLVPNVMPLLIVNATSALGGIILTEATLGFLGFGVKYPLASWGAMINQVNDMYVMQTAWWIWIPAGLLILLTVLGFNFVGDGLRDAFDPKMKR